MKVKLQKIILTILMTVVVGLLSSNIIASASFESELAAFPESYKPYLRALHNAYPNWSFTAFNTGLEWKDVIKNEMKPKSNFVQSDDIASWKSVASGDYNIDSGTWVVKSQPSSVQASEAIVKYYMDPRNFLNKDYIFQFETLRYNSSGHTKSGIETVLKNTFMYDTVLEDKSGKEKTDKYSDSFLDIGKSNNINPLHLAARVRQEQGVNGTSPLISGTYSGYKGYYNYFNFGASGATREDIYIGGLQTAKDNGWNSRYKSLAGGSKKLADSYINRGQDTLYLQKFDVDSTSDGLYWHQYMQTLTAPTSESTTLRNAYVALGYLGKGFQFRIPVYKNMPAKACAKPTAEVVTPTLYKLTKTSADYAKMTWMKVAGGNGYLIYRKTGNGSYKKIKSITKASTTSFTDKSVKDGVTYAYKIRAYKNGSSTKYSSYSSGKSIAIPVSKPKSVKIKKNSKTSITLSWGISSTASGYEVYRSTGNDAKYTLIKKVSGRKTKKFTDKNLNQGFSYRYKIRSYKKIGSKTIYSSYTSPVELKASIASPNIYRIASKDYNIIKMVWNKVKNVDGYYIYRSAKKKSGFKKIATIEDVNITSYYDTLVSTGRTYYYKMKSYKNPTEENVFVASSISKAVSAKSELLEPTYFKVSSENNGEMNLSWQEVNGAEGYEIYRSVGKGKFKLIKRISEGTTLSYIDSGVKKGMTYTYMIKSRRALGSKFVYSKESKKRKCKAI